LPQKSNNEYPSTAVGTMNGISDKVSNMLIHRDFLRAISHAIGMPVTRSIEDTRRAIVKEFSTADRARDTRSGWFRTSFTVPNSRKIPRRGGRRIKTKNRTTAAKYTVYLVLLREERLSNAAANLGFGKAIPFRSLRLHDLAGPLP
jgi:hypothetical protein